MKILINIAILLISLTGFSQAGKISGKVIATKSGELLSGSTIKLEGTQFLTKTDQSGEFNFSNVPAGTYSITVSFVSYETKTVTEIVVKANEVTYINISLDQPTKSTLDNVVVTTSRSAKQESVASLLTFQKNSAVVSDGIPAEIIRRTPDRNTSDVLKRVSGVSIQDNKFAVVRGLNDRYNAAFLNGAPLPSTENDRKAFAFDIFPANMLDNLVILKTASPDMPGDFAGGVINITTTGAPSKNFTSVSIGTGFNTITTFKNGFTYQGGKTDWLGLSDNTRDIPSGVPDTKNFPNTSAGRAAAAKNYTTNNWGLIERNVLPNYNFQITQGLNLPLKGKEFFGMLLSATYSRNFAYSYGELSSFEYNPSNPSAPPATISNYKDNVNSEQTLAGLVGNFSFKINNNNKIGFRNILSINSDDRVIIRNGTPDLNGDPDFKSANTALWYTSNLIYSGQVSGDHNFSKAKIKLNWLAGLGKVDRKIPDLRQMAYGLSSGADKPTAALPSATVSNDNGGSMFHNNTLENIYSGKIDLSRNIDFGDNFRNSIKVGGYVQYRDRSFEARLLGFAPYRGPGGFDNSLLQLPQGQIFDPSHMGVMSNGKSGFLLLDGTNPTFAYDATSRLYAAYIMADSRIGQKLRAIYGVRYEYFNQVLDSYTDFTTKLSLDTKKADFLPSLNLVYSLNTKQNIRFSYSKTLNRPEFRELAPFAFYDFNNRIVVGGNPNLARATIQNYDIRYEVFPGRGQVLSVSAFYKDFTNPIELASDPNNNNSTQYQNAIEGVNYGVEVEMRTQLGTLVGNKDGIFLNRITAFANASLIFSNVKEAPFAGVVKGTENRPLQGQSPYLFNLGLSYLDTDNGWSSTISANRVGQRIFIVGSQNEADNWEQGRTVVDFQVAKSLMNQKMELKLNVKDLLRQRQVFFLDQNKNSKFDKGSDPEFQSRNFGSVISISASYKF